jgi:excisionase family DNA binding protein
MPHRVFSVEEAAEYLHLTATDVQQRVKDREIPFEKRGDRVVFRKRDIDMWASQRILGLSENKLADYHHKSTRGIREYLPQEAILPDLLERGAIDSAMKAKTKASVLRELVGLAEKTWQVCDARELLASLEAREQLCSTGVPGGLALPHPRFQQPYLFESSFIVVGRPIQEIHFGAPDGRPTDLFFLICCQDDRLHLHTLARLCLMAVKTDVIAQLRQAPDANSMRDCLFEAERAVLPNRKEA